MTKAAVRAVKDAISRSCLCGLVEVLGRRRFEGVRVHVRVGVPEPAAVDKAAVLAVVPIGEKVWKSRPAACALRGWKWPASAPDAAISSWPARP